VRNTIAHIAQHSYDQNHNSRQIANFFPFLLLELFAEESEFLSKSHEIAKGAVLRVFMLQIDATAVSY
jgi:hypothetical protein